MHDLLHLQACTIGSLSTQRPQLMEGHLTPLRHVAALQPHPNSSLIQRKIDIRAHAGFGHTQATPKDSAVPEWGT
jgi:hypothetical protein